jgi:hypothetical protein
VLREGYGSPTELKDIVRGMFVAPTTSIANERVSLVRGHWDIAEDKGEKALDDGYYDHKLIVDFGDGIRGEVQIVPDVIWKAKKSGLNAIYEKRRALADQESPEALALQQQMIDGYAKAVAGTAWEKSWAESMSASGNALAKAAGDKVLRSLDASPGAERQEPSRQTAPQDLPSTTPEITGRPSISENTNDIAGNVGNAPDVGNVSPPSREQQLDEGYDLAGQQTLPPNPNAPGYGATNRIFTADAADAARERIRAKLEARKLSRDQRGSFDPEMAMDGMVLAGFHVEAGARKFADVARKLADQLETTLSDLKPYLAAWYNGARDMLEGQGEDISDMDGAGAVRAAVGMIAEPSVTPAVDGIGENEDASTTTTQAATRADRAGDEGPGAGDVSALEGPGRAGESPDSTGGDGGGELRNGAQPGAGRVEQDESIARGVAEPADAGTERGSERSAPRSRGVRRKSTGRGANFLAPTGGLKRSGSWRDAANRNLDVIELVNKIEGENRPATPDEQAKLAKFVGWGASEIRNKLFNSVDRRTMTIPQAQPWNEWKPRRSTAPMSC